MSVGHMENLQEERVFKLIREMLQGDEFSHVCKCSDCFIDIAALALNSLPPEYVADKFYKFPEGTGSVQSKRDAAEGAIRRAIDKVTDHPHHE